MEEILQPEEIPVPKPKPLEPEYFDKDAKPFYRIGGRCFRIDTKDIKKETPIIVECSGKRKHILFPKSEKFINISGFTDEELQKIKEIL